MELRVMMWVWHINAIAYRAVELPIMFWLDDDDGGLYIQDIDSGYWYSVPEHKGQSLKRTRGWGG